jgi:hypothetical protein
MVSSVVKIASQIAHSDEFACYPSLSERTRKENRRKGRSAPDRRAASLNRRNAARSDSGSKEEDTHTRV